MINRRILRVKTMQSLYAFRVVKDANIELSKEHLSTYFEPNYMAKVPENKGLLRENEKIAQHCFNAWIKDNTYNFDKESDKVVHALNFSINHYKDLLKNDTSKSKKRLLVEIEKIYDKYVLALDVLEALQLISININEHTNNFGKNKALEILKNNKNFKQEKNNRSISWSEDIAQLRKLYRDSVSKDTEFLIYQDVAEPTFEEDKGILLYIIRKIVFEDETIASLLEENDLYWIENRNILKGMLKKTIKSISEEEDQELLLELSSNWEDDKDFISKLFEESVKAEKETVLFITKKAANWDSERLALTDIIILNMGLAEMLNFPNIPIKVTINEYIEVSKLYSTPKSKQFINGLLDSISKDLISDGRIRKSGRGLIDTK